MASSTQYDSAHNALKFESIRADLENALDYARLARYSEDKKEIVKYRRKACAAYEDVLHTLKTAVLTNIEWEWIKTKMQHLEYALTPSEPAMV